ncbi:MAG: hypothetical protein ACT4P7_13275 [Gemmatimonadaceae bacterium]
MDVTVVAARLVHVGLGVFWGGAVLFSAFFLDPAARSAGPAGGQVMAALGQRRWVETIITLGTLTILSGFYLFWRVSGGFSAEYSRSPAGIAYGIGGFTAVCALVIGIVISRPTAARIGSLMASLPSIPDTERGAVLAQVGPLRAKLTVALRTVATLLGITIVTMAVGRYL